MTITLPYHVTPVVCDPPALAVYDRVRVNLLIAEREDYDTISWSKTAFVGYLVATYPKFIVLLDREYEGQRAIIADFSSLELLTE